MDDIEALCSRVMMIGHGQILMDGSLDQLRARVTTERRLVIDLEEEDEIRDPYAEVIQVEGNRVTLRFDPVKTSTADLIGRISSRYLIRDLFVENPPIEEVIAKLYQEVRI
jgi:ABC-2 type transport system ATP-binding protein